MLGVRDIFLIIEKNGRVFRNEINYIVEVIVVKIMRVLALKVGV